MSVRSLIHDRLLRCPVCAGPIVETSDSLNLCCEQCARIFPVENGVVFFLENRDHDRRGVISRTFSRPQFYRRIIDLKWWVMGLLKVQDELLGIQEFAIDKEVLDVGCGPYLDIPSNEIPFRLAKRFVGLDFSANFVRFARGAHPELNCDFIQASAAQLPFPDNSFDTVVAAFTIHHVVESPELVVSELFRVAKETVIIFDHIKSDRNIIAKLQSLYWRLVDGGFHYQTSSEWQVALNGRQPEKSLQTGALGSHVIKQVFRV